MKKTTTLIIFALILLLIGCGLISPVTESERDTSKKYDGRWNAYISKDRFKYKRKIDRSNWTWYCSKIYGRLNLNIKDGEMTGSFYNYDQTKRHHFKTFINVNGYFLSEPFLNGRNFQININSLKQKFKTYYKSYQIGGKIDLKDNTVSAYVVEFSDLNRQLSCRYEFDKGIKIEEEDDDEEPNDGEDESDEDEDGDEDE